MLHSLKVMGVYTRPNGCMVLFQTTEKKNIMTLELYPIILALVMWGFLWKNHFILFFTDNEALVAVTNKQTSQDNHVMKMVRCMVLRCLQNHWTLLKAKHIPGKKNVFADYLSRLQVEQFRQLATWAQVDPCLVPEHFLPQNVCATLQYWLKLL